MSIQMKLWRIEKNRPEPLPSAKLDLEKRLEDWICQDLSLVGDDLLLLGRQVATAYGHAIDVLALDREGNLVILELKRGRTPRDVVSQVLDYASWTHDLEDQDVGRLAETYRERPLEALFKERFKTELPQPLNGKQRLIIVATELDSQSERIVQFLSSQYGVNVNVVFFDYYKHNDQEFVGRSWLIAPEEVERKSATRGRERTILTLEDLAALAEARSVGDLYKALHEGLSQLADQVGTTQSNVTYRWRSLSGSRNALVSVYPKVSGRPEPGLLADIRVDDLARQLEIPPADLRAALPAKQIQPRQIPGLYLYAEGYAFRSREEIDRFLEALGGPQRFAAG